MPNPKVTVHLDEGGGVAAVEVEGHSVPSKLDVTVPSGPIAPFSDEEFKERLLPWMAAG